MRGDLPLAGMRVLVMEDEHLIAMDVELLCREHGAAEVVLVHALDEAGEMLADAAAPDAGILDVALAGQPTFGVARELAARGIPFVFATGHADAEGLFDGFPDVAVIGKPFAGGALMEALAAAIARTGGDAGARSGGA